MQAALADAAVRDQDIVALLQRGALEHALSLLLERYEAKVYRLCYALLRESSEAQDAAQESWIRIWRALPDFDAPTGSLSTWIYAITRNRCLSALQRRRATASLSEAAVSEEVEAVSAAEPALEDRCELLRRLIGRLPERERRVLALFYYQERSVREVAEMLAIPEGTVKTLLYRARAALAEELRRRHLDDPGIWLETRP